jgi:hypothetical protein
MQTRAVVTSALVLSLSTTAGAQAASRCTHETLSVRGTPLTATYCVTGLGTAPLGRDLPVRVLETFSTPHSSLSREAAYRFIAGESASRVIEDVPLERLGLSGTLHLTLLLERGLVHIDGAMLTPGAVTIK